MTNAELFQCRHTEAGGLMILPITSKQPAGSPRRPTVFYITIGWVVETMAV